MVRDVVFMFEVHQPYRLAADKARKLLHDAFSGRSVSKRLEELVFNHMLDREVFERVARSCYIPTTRILLEASDKLAEEGHSVRFSFSISGVFIEQAKRYKPEVIDLLSKGVEKGFFEIIEQTYYHTLASLLPDPDEFIDQLRLHRDTIKEVFGVEPRVAENTEMIYNNDIARIFYQLGYEAAITEGVDWVLGWRSPNYVYRAWGVPLRLLLRNYRLSDDIGFRFSMTSWDQYPLTADKYAEWLRATPGDVVLIAVDYETFGEHHKPETGIHGFLRHLPREITRRGLRIMSAEEAARSHQPVDTYDVPGWATISWADERDTSAWLGNEMQQRVFRLYAELEPYAKAIGGWALRAWRLLGISDHYYYMATKTGPAGEVHHYFSPYKSPYAAYQYYVEALTLLLRDIVDEIAKNPTKYVTRIRLPRSRAFYFYMPNGIPLGISARSIKELIEAVEKVPIESLIYHVKRGDLQHWLRTQFFLDNEVEKIDKALRHIANARHLRRIIRRILLKILERGSFS
ncbi:glycoside hydrolase family 57 protein [Pyrofollis japonicus]|uniref:alpha-amylase n=1 Tax=Pyrofollis japonicus TaxID=3060460 RepID=UPI00295B92FF|nr:alpha-amylase [Pyrofollis japonicus]BEP17451.1 glycoside hydrolase family 57 protein [Pyrofollis japonicus]